MTPQPTSTPAAGVVPLAARPATPPEIVPVRPGEDLAWDRLEAFLRTELDLSGSFSVLQFPNGSANLTYQLTFGDRVLVLRRPPFGAIAPGAHDMKREFRVLSKLWAFYDRAPRSFLYCSDHAVVGSDFVVSEYRPGVVVWAALPPSLASIDGAARAVGFATVEALAELHLVDVAAADLLDLGRPDGYLARQVDGWRKRWDLVATPNFDPLMAPLGERLHATLPASARASLVHNDFKVDNCQFTPGHPERVTSVFDWDQATLGDPLADIGMLLTYWPDPSDTADDHALTPDGLETLGLPTRAEITERYAAVTGFDVSSLGWYEAFTSWKTCVVLQQLHQRYVRGESTDERMATRDQHIAMLANRATRILAAADLPETT